MASRSETGRIAGRIHFGFAIARASALLLLAGGLTAGCAGEKCLDPWQVTVLKSTETSDGLLVDVQGPMESLWYVSHVKMSRRNNTVRVRVYSSMISSKEVWIGPDQLRVPLKADDNVVALTDGRQDRVVWQRRLDSE